MAHHRVAEMSADLPSPRVFGIEGTAWAASASYFDGSDGSVLIETDPFIPDHGGIDPSEAAEHMTTALPGVIESVLTSVDGSIDAVAFSRGPGLGPCLRVTAAAARGLAHRLDVPLVGVNHMVAHAEIGRILGEMRDPIALNASGANAHVLGFRDGRYRVLGETMDTGVGNSLDKFARHLGWQHPGGPQIERHASAGSYVSLPYVVKGMDLSFSGIVSAAKDLVDEGTPVEDVCCGLQETVFAMLTEVTERALALTHRDELVLGGGVAHNGRLREMLETMTEDRGARFYVPPDRFLGDNAGMIAITGAAMLDAGVTVSIEASTVRPDDRPDDVAVTWRDPSPKATAPHDGIQRGAEAIVETVVDDNVRKVRAPKPYRHPALDESLRRARTIQEARLLHAARRVGVPTPTIVDVDPDSHTLLMAHVGVADLRDRLTTQTVSIVGEHLGRLHTAGIVHGDPTVRNVRIDDDRVYLLDFGLGFHSDDVEDWAMDLHVFLQSLQDVAPDRDAHRDALLKGYDTTGGSAAIERLDAIEGRGRYR